MVCLILSLLYISYTFLFHSYHKAYIKHLRAIIVYFKLVEALFWTIQKLYIFNPHFMFLTSQFTSFMFFYQLIIVLVIIFNTLCFNLYALVIDDLPTTMILVVVIIDIWYQISNNKLLILLLFSHSAVSVSFAALWTVVHQALLFMGFPRHEYWSGLPFPFPGHLPSPGIEPAPVALHAVHFFSAESLGKPHDIIREFWI